jgi:vancomycin resistance protein YoaR
MSETTKKSNKAVKILLVLLLLILAIGVGVGIYAYSVIDTDAFYPGVKINGMDVSQYTKQQAQEKISQYTQEMLDEINLNLTYKDQTWHYDATSINAQYNVEDVVNQAWQVGRTGNFIENFKEIKQVEKDGINFDLTYSYSSSMLEAELKTIADQINTQPVDAQVSFSESGDKRGEAAFEYSEDKEGVGMLVEDAMTALISQVNEKNYQTYEIPFQVLEPSVRLADVEKWTSLLGSYSTKLSNNSDRTHNVTLSSSAYDGVILLPGETYSLNESTGPRDLADGYLNAHVIEDGVRYTDAPGGGNCQTSTTLYGAVVRSDLEIVERFPHSIPSSYTALGQDATVNYPYADFKFMNNSEAPIFVDRYFTQSGGYDWLNVDIYGKEKDEWDSIDLVTKVITKGDVPPITYKADNSFTAGQINSEMSYSSRALIKVETYRVYYKDGKEVNRVKEASSSYRETHGVTYVGTLMADGSVISLEEAKIAAGLAPAVTVTPVQ